MKISKEKLKQIIKEELEEADMRGRTTYDNPSQQTGRDALRKKEADAASKQRRNAYYAVKILDELSSLYSFVKGGQSGNQSPEQGLYSALVGMKNILRSYMGAVHDQDPDLMSIGEGEEVK